MSGSEQQNDWKNLFEREKQARKVAEKRTSTLICERDNALSEITKLEKAQRQFQDLIATAGEYTWETDRNFRITHISNQAAISFGYSVEELTDLPLATALNIDSDESEHSVDFFAQLFKNKSPFRGQILKCRNEAGSSVWQSLSGEPILGSDHTFLGFRGTGRDITEIQEAREKAQKAEQAKSIFLSKMSHEIRTPLNGIVGMSQILIDTNLKDHQQGYAHTIKRSANSLVSLINQIFDSPHVEAPLKPEGENQAASSKLLLNKRCLIVDDNIVNQRVAMAMLNTLGARTHLASSGQEALLILAENSFDLILMDINMPDMDGVETTERIRAKQIETPIMAVTTDAPLYEQKRFTKAGMNGYLSKPLTKVILAAALSEILNSAPSPEQATPREPPARSHIFGADQLLALFSQDKKITQDVVKEFMIQVKIGMDQLEQALEENDTLAVQNLLHTLSGSAYNLRANDFAQACSDFRGKTTEDAPHTDIKHGLLLVKSSYRILAEELQQFTRN